MIRFRIPKGQGKYLVISSLILALLVAPFALAADGDPMVAGGRTTFTKITRVLGDSTTYATQQSNLHNGDGGAARYGCRSSAANEYCLLSKNTGGGGSFRFTSANSLLGGVIDVDPPQGKTPRDAKPFTTNATGVATGLNADRLDGMNAADIIKAAGGTPAGGPSATQPPFAQVTTDGKLGTSRGTLSSSKPATGHYQVVFSGDLGGCAVQATPVTSNSTTISAQVTVAGDKKSSTVDLRVFNFVTAAGGAVSVIPADETAHVAFTC